MLHIEHPSQTATRLDDATPIDLDATLFVALELSLSSWVVVASAPGEDKASKHGVVACDGPGLLALLDRLRTRAEARCGRPMAIVVMQEAGRDGFWVHRLLEAHGVRSVVVDPSSMAVNRSRAKTGRIDAEDARRINREREALLAERIRHANRIKGRRCRPALRTRSCARWTGSNGTAAPRHPYEAPGARLLRLKGVGSETASVLAGEAFFRDVRNRREVASYAGLAPSPWQSGSVDHVQGISKAGNARMRKAMGQLAWLWLRNPPDSALSAWYRERVRDGRGRIKRIAITARARKLLVALWRVVTHGLVPTGAVLKPAQAG